MKRFITLLLLLISISASAEIYRWVDENGKVQYSDKKPEDTKVEEVNVKVNSYTHVKFESLRKDQPVPASKNSVIMYSTSWCGYCKKAREYFHKKGIKYREYDIEKSRSAKRAYDKIDGQGVPVILVGNKKMTGFSEAGFRRIYIK